MNKIEKLIKELCPNGMEWKKLEEVCEIGTGNSNRQDATDNGQYPFFVRSKDVLKIDTFEYSEESIIIPGEGGIGDIFHYIKGKYALHQRAYRVHPISDKLCGKFLYYYLFANFKLYINSKAVNATVTSIRKPMLEGFPIPLPPLPIQTEIVRILDKFVEQQEQIEKLIELRKKQYEYYRKELLKPKEGEKWETKTLGEIGKISIGKKPNEILDKGTFEYINAGTTCSGYSETYNFEGDTITTPSRGEGGIGFVGYQKKRFWCGPLCYAIKTSENNKFIYHYLTLHNKLILDLKCEGGVPALNRKDLITIEIQVPPVAVQEKIVHTLDSFETSITNLTSALEASKRRYEYYRDKMMRF